MFPEISGLLLLDDVQLADKIRHAIPGTIGEQASDFIRVLKVSGRVFKQLTEADLKVLSKDNSDITEIYLSPQGKYHRQEHRQSLVGVYPELASRILRSGQFPLPQQEVRIALEHMSTADFLSQALNSECDHPYSLGLVEVPVDRHPEGLDTVSSIPTGDTPSFDSDPIQIDELFNGIQTGMVRSELETENVPILHILDAPSALVPAAEYTLQETHLCIGSTSLSPNDDYPRDAGSLQVKTSSGLDSHARPPDHIAVDGNVSDPEIICHKQDQCAAAISFPRSSFVPIGETFATSTTLLSSSDVEVTLNISPSNETMDPRCAPMSGASDMPVKNRTTSAPIFDTAGHEATSAVEFRGPHICSTSSGFQRDQTLANSFDVFKDESRITSALDLPLRSRGHGFQATDIHHSCVSDGPSCAISLSGLSDSVTSETENATIEAVDHACSASDSEGNVRLGSATVLKNSSSAFIASMGPDMLNMSSDAGSARPPSGSNILKISRENSLETLHPYMGSSNSALPRNISGYHSDGSRISACARDWNSKYTGGSSIYTWAIESPSQPESVCSTSMLHEQATSDDERIAGSHRFVLDPLPSIPSLTSSFKEDWQFSPTTTFAGPHGQGHIPTQAHWAHDATGAALVTEINLRRMSERETNDTTISSQYQPCYGAPLRSTTYMSSEAGGCHRSESTPSRRGSVLSTQSPLHIELELPQSSLAEELSSVSPLFSPISLDGGHIGRHAEGTHSPLKYVSMGATYRTPPFVCSRRTLWPTASGHDGGTTLLRPRVTATPALSQNRSTNISQHVQTQNQAKNTVTGIEAGKLHRDKRLATPKCKPVSQWSPLPLWTGLKRLFSADFCRIVEPPQIPRRTRVEITDKYLLPTWVGPVTGLTRV
ncbi:hypothetical protein Hypma_006260 [Hypsizygus marmoreus]|uniref:Uncharacterized protein n=1 Tax=Hypsizygus marmoreus TaxID=39966 RepID=A0A369JVS2_HYPMA|nr:hypothetical protein Hypma_006260 [Hypsizygus marmoreus]